MSQRGVHAVRVHVSDLRRTRGVIAKSYSRTQISTSVFMVDNDGPPQTNFKL